MILLKMKIIIKINIQNIGIKKKEMKIYLLK